MQRLLCTLALCLAVATSAFAQATGTVAGTVSDEQGGVLPGVTVTIVGNDRTATFTTEADGKYRFLNLPPGAYRLTAELTGFSTVVREGVVVVVGQNVDLPINLRVATVQETITVTGDSPIVDTKATGTATNFTQAELDKVPTSRDPWALLRTVPGVMVDRVNIAGNETGQQSNFQSKGTRPADAVWTMDGVVITDMAAIGASPTYFNYDNFEEIQVSTSGQDVRQQTGGVGLNFVVKRGTNQLKGMARGYFTNDSLEGSNVPDEMAALGVTPDSSDHNDQISDWGIELGGPIVKERAWIYGSYSSQDIRLVRSAGNLIDRTILDTWNIKGNVQATSKDMVSVLWFLGSKEKFGRSPGVAGITHQGPSTWDQGGAYEDGRPHGLLKIEDSRVFSSSFYLTGKYAYYNTGFGLVPAGGLDQEAGLSQRLGVSFGSYQQQLFLRPQHSVNVDTSYFSKLGDLKFGFGWRRTDAFSQAIWPGNMILAFDNSLTDRVARVYREGAGSNRTEYLNFYVGDTITKNRWTIDLGLRYDRQGGKALPSQTRSNGAFPELVPGINFAGYDSPFTWSDFSPRAGVTYALDEARKTILRASIGRYAGQLDTATVGYMNPTSTAGYAEYRWVDLNTDQLAQGNEVQLDQFIGPGGGFNPANPTAVTSANQIDPDLDAPVTTSVVAGIDRELMENLAVQANYSFTRTSRYAGSTTFTPWIGVDGDDYLPGPLLTGTLPDGSPYSVQTFVPDPALVTAGGNGRFLTNWDGYHSQYSGLELGLVKRMSDRWMARIGAAFISANEYYDQNPRRDNLGNPTRLDTEPLVDGGAFVVRSAGSGAGDIFIHGKWQFSANGVYQAPGGIDLGASLFGRQGYPFPVYRLATLGRDGTNQRVLVSPELDTERLDNLWNLDLRAAKSFRWDRANIELIADLFNVMNANPILVRNRNAGSAAFQQPQQVLSPRIVRFGVRLNF
ncbi:MAG TPA: TonB-dependent receptor [Vicinamibacterales bacterium]|jgi:hypothetical protein|nr:TonB-dependent receptor [Vicinamibacterales bacterium]